jgi:hypothetical protein
MGIDVAGLFQMSGGVVPTLRKGVSSAQPKMGIKGVGLQLDGLL